MRRYSRRLTHPFLALPLSLCYLALARAGIVRNRAAIDRLALHATRLFPGRGPCCSGIPSSTISQPATLVAWLLFPYLILADVQNTVLSAC